MKEKIKGILIVIIAMLIASGTTATALLVTKAENITLDSDKIEKTNVASALDGLYEVVEDGYCPENWNCTFTPPPPPKCVRATTLHTEICSQTSTSQYCSATGSIGNGNTITYGNATTTEGELHTGDAFDCDVDGTGYNHRFYYVSDLYTEGIEGSETFDTNIAVLIYYSNVLINGNILNANNKATLSYNSSNTNYVGPLTAIEYIPGNNLWTNLSINENRQIRSETGTTSVTQSGTTYPITFSGYTTKAARLLTTQEINRGCDLTSNTLKNNGSLDTDKCRFLLENTLYANNNTKLYSYSYWLETPKSSYNDMVWLIFGHVRSAGTNQASYDGNNNGGVRPAIEVAKSDISY